MSSPEMLAPGPYSLPRAEKEARLLARLSELTEHHRAACPPYARVLDLLWDGGYGPFASLAEVPWLPVQLFKTHELSSIPAEDIFKVLTSSGTTGSARSRIVLDRESALAQTRTLASIMAALLGSERRPMLIVDARETLRDRRAMAARAAGILGFQTFGRDHLYALDADMRLRREELRDWLASHSGEPLFVFGFTFMVWRHLLDSLSAGEIDLSRAVLIHGGGWKQLQAEAVSAERFRARLREVTGLQRVASFYGMVEQIGTVFLECERGFLHAPAAADVLIRDPSDWSVAPDGAPGVVQVLSSLPTSYPGHSLLTEDLGTVHGRDECGCGWLGASVSLDGRVPKAELRGCSDTHAASLSEAA